MGPGGVKGPLILLFKSRGITGIHPRNSTMVWREGVCV